MIALVVFSPENAVIFKDVRLRALQDSPTAFSSTYAEESKLMDADWVKRAAQWSGKESTAYLAMEAGLACGIAARYLDKETLLADTWRRCGSRRRIAG